MGRQGKGSCKWNSKIRVRSKDNGSDDSDEDYVVSDEEEVEEESEVDLEEYCSPFDGDASEGSFRNLVGEQEDELDEVEGEEKRKRKRKKCGRPKANKGCLGNWKIGRIRSRKRRRLVYEEEEEEEEEDGDYEEEEDEVEEERRTRTVGRPKENKGSLGNEKNEGVASGKSKRVLYDKEEEEEEKEEDGDYEERDEVEKPNVEKGSLGTVENGGITSRQRHSVLYDKEEEDDADYEEEYNDDDDEEFTPDDDVFLDEEEEVLVGNKKNNLKAGKRRKQKKRSGDGRRRRKKYSVPKEPLRKRGRQKRGRKRKEKSDDDGDFINDSIVVRKNAKKKSSSRKDKHIVPSDSDCLSSGASDYEYTISDEEREQVREASKLLKTSSRTLSSLKGIQETEDSRQLRKPSVKKGKEKVEITKSEVLKQVCGICLSEEDKRRLRGTLDCCSHFFCFTCIMEWSKVESRCPLCKQRFKTISKPARSTPVVDLREVVIQVPERDQVYQPTEEELRSYLDPYENVICTECHQGGDDGLMLLCDLCDSSAHTYCVGLGREVPEGNWYCEGCRPVALGSSSFQAPSPSPDQRTVNDLYNRPLPFVNSGDFIDPTLLSSPHTPFSHGFGNLSSPRFHNGNNVLETSPSGSGAPTLSRRRTLHRHIQNLLNYNRLSNMAGNGRTCSASNANNGFFIPPIGRSRDITMVQPVRTQEMGTPLWTIFEEKVRDNDNNPSSSAHAEDIFSSRSGHLRGEETVQIQTNTSFTDRPVNLTLWPGLTGIGPASGFEQFQQNSGIPNTGSVFRVSSEGDFSVAREQLQLMVKTHLKNLPRHIDLGQGNFNEIATYSIHTILAACGLEHRSNLVHVVPSLVTCSHVGRVVGEERSSSLMKGCCSSCFDSFVKDVVKMIMDTRLPQWLSLGL